jgi:hypothetical protein
MAAAAPVNAAQLAAEFVQRDAALKKHSKELAPVRRQRKEMHDHLQQLLEATDPAHQQITLADGTVVTLKATEHAAPVKQEYVAAQLQEQLGLGAPQAEEIARRMWDERPKKTSYKVVYGNEAAAAAAGPGASGPAASRKRAAARS